MGPSIIILYLMLISANKVKPMAIDPKEQKLINDPNYRKIYFSCLQSWPLGFLTVIFGYEKNSQYCHKYTEFQTSRKFYM